MIGEMAGASVRDRDGMTGKIIRWQLPTVAIAWEERGRAVPREETLDRTNPRLRNQIEVMTLDAGWVPLGNFMSETGVPMHSTITQLRKLIAEADQAVPLFEKGKAHWPFKNKSHLGPGPRDGENDQTDNWDCKCADYKCVCKSGDKERKVRIDRAYKREYNKEYKRWRAKNPG